MYEIIYENGKVISMVITKKGFVIETAKYFRTETIGL